MSSTDHDPSTNGSGASRSADPTDVFDNLEAIRLTPEESGRVGSKELIVTVPVRKPGRAEFVRVHPDPKWSLATAIYVDQLKEVYFVAPEARSLFLDGLAPIMLFTAVTQRAIPFLWPVALDEGIGGRRNSWNDSAREAPELAKRQWVRVVSDMAAGSYRVYEALGKLPDPVFPDKPLTDLLRIAFRGRIIDNQDHTVVKQMLGITV
jgi:hypothetical protein